MTKKGTLSILAAIILGITALLFMNAYLERQKAELFKGMEMVEALVVKEEISPGTLLDLTLIAKRKIPQKYLHRQAILPADVDTIVGRRVIHPVGKGDPILWSDLSKSDEKNSLSQSITKGQRALSLPVDEASSVSGLLVPNDRVDILGTFTDQKNGERVTTTLLQNVRVLATGGRTAIDIEKEGLENQGGYGTITLLVSQEEAEILVFAQEQGRLIYLLRNREDTTTEAEIPRISLSSILKPEVRESLQKKRDTRVEVIRGGSSDDPDMP